MKTFNNIEAMIRWAFATGKIACDTSQWLHGLCQYGSPAIAAAYLQKVQPYKVNQFNETYELI